MVITENNPAPAILSSVCDTQSDTYIPSSLIHSSLEIALASTEQQLPNFYKEPDLVDETVPATVSRVGTPRAAVSAPDVGSTLAGVNHDGAEGHADQPAPGRVMDVGALSRSGR